MAAWLLFAGEPLVSCHKSPKVTLTIGFTDNWCKSLPSQEPAANLLGLASSPETTEGQTFCDRQTILNQFYSFPMKLALLDVISF